MKNLTEQVEEILKTSSLEPYEVRHILRVLKNDSPKKPLFKHNEITNILRINCPTCGKPLRMKRNFLIERNKYCACCGQKIDWTNEILTDAMDRGLIDTFA